MHPVHAVDDPAGIFQAARRVGEAFLDRQVRVVKLGVDLAFVRGSEKLCQTEVFAARAPFVIQRRFVSGDNAAAVPDIFRELRALAVGEGGDVGQDQDAVPADVVFIEKKIVHHVERNTRFHQCLVIAQRMVLDLAAIISGALLGINDRHIRQRFFIPRYFSFL